MKGVFFFVQKKRRPKTPCGHNDQEETSYSAATHNVQLDRGVPRIDHVEIFGDPL